MTRLLLATTQAKTKTARYSLDRNLTWLFTREVSLAENFSWPFAKGESLAENFLGILPEGAGIYTIYRWLC